MSGLPINFKIDETPYRAVFHGEGGYNRVYRFLMNGRQRVLKIPKLQASGAFLSHPDRAVRVMKGISPDLNPELVMVKLETEPEPLLLWVADFQVQSSSAPRDAEIAAAVLAEYQKPDGRIIYDADVLGNFMAVDGPPDRLTGVRARKVLCVDVDQAVRRGSDASERFMSRVDVHAMMTTYPGIIMMVVGNLCLKEFQVYGRLTPDQKRALIERVAIAALEKTFESIQALDGSVAFGDRDSRARRTEDSKLFLPFISPECLLKLVASYLEDERHSRKFQILLEILPDERRSELLAQFIEGSLSSTSVRSIPDQLALMIKLYPHYADSDEILRRIGALGRELADSYSDPTRFEREVEKLIWNLLKNRQPQENILRVLASLMPELEPVSQKKMIQKGLIAATKEIFQKLELSRSRLLAGQIGRVAHQEEQRLATQDLKRVLQDMSSDDLTALADEFLKGEDTSPRFRQLLELLPAASRSRLESNLKQLSVVFVTPSQEDLLKHLTRLIRLFCHGCLDFDDSNLAALAEALSSSWREDREKFNNYVEKHVSDALRMCLVNVMSDTEKTDLIDDFLKTLIPGSDPATIRTREAIFFSAYVNVIVMMRGQDSEKSKKIDDMLRQADVTQEAKDRAWSKGKPLEKYLDKNLYALVRGLNLTQVRERLRAYGLSGDRAEDLVLRVLKRSMVTVFVNASALCTSQDKSRLSQNLCKELEAKSLTECTPDALAKMIYQMERVISHKSFGFRRFGHYSSDFKAFKDQFNKIREFYAEMFPHAPPLIPQAEILKPKTIKATGEVLTFKGMLAEEKSRAHSSRDPDRRGGGAGF